MANQKMNLDAQVSVSFNVAESSNELTKMAKNLSGVDQKIKSVGTRREEQIRELESKMRGLAAEGASKMASGEFAANPSAQIEFQQKMNDLKAQYYRITNLITGAYLSGLAKTKEEEDTLKKINNQMLRKQKQIEENVQKMDELAKKTKEIQDIRAKTANILGIDQGKLGGVDSINAMIAERTNARGFAKPNKKEERDALIKYRDLLQQNTEEIAKQEEELLKVRTELEKQIKELRTIRETKSRTLNTIIDQAVAEDKIDESQGKLLKGLIEEEKMREKIAEEAKKTEVSQKTQEIDQNIKANKRLKDANDDVKKSFLGKITAATLYYAALRTLRRLYSSVVNTVKELDKSMTEIAMVTHMNRKETWELVGAFQELAFEIGITTHEIARLSVYFFRQGRSAKDALELTRVAAIAAKVASIDVMESANYLTSAVNGFGLAADQAMRVSDRFAALAASSASSYEEMAIALSKVAPVAKTAGVGIDFMMGMLAKGIETTREAPENIGTAFKTVFARMTQIRDFGATLEEGMSVNTVEKALKLAGVALRNASGEFRNMDEVLEELGYQWDSLNRNEQAYIATALAGTRQQSRLLAVMQNFDRTMELVNISMNSAGATLAQQAEYAGGMEAATARLTNAWEKLILAFTNTEGIIKFINWLSNAVKTLAEEVERNLDVMLALAGIITTTLVVALTMLNKKLTLTAALSTIASGGLNLVIAAGVALGAAGLYAIFRRDKEEAEKLNDELKEISENIKQTEVDIYNFAKTSSEIENLIDRYDELQEKVFKNNEELEEMNSILENIDKYSNEEYDFVVNGKLNSEARDFVAIMKTQMAEAEQDAIGLGREALSNIAEQRRINADYQIDPATQRNLNQYFAYQEALKEGKDFFEMEASEQQKYLNIVQSNFDSYLTYYTDVIAVREEAEATFNKTKSLASLINSDISIGEEYYNFQEYLRQLRVLSESDTRIFQILVDAENGLLNPQQIMNELNRISAMDSASRGQTQIYSNIISQTAKDLYSDLESVIDGTISGQQAAGIWQRFFNLTPNDQKALANSFDKIADIFNSNATLLEDIINKRIFNETGFATFNEKIGMITALENAGFSEEQITEFFDGITHATINGVSRTMDAMGITGELLNKAMAEIYNLLTGGQTPQSVLDNLYQLGTAGTRMVEFQSKYQQGTLTGEEMAEVASALGPSGLLDEFLSGSLTVDLVSEETKNQAREDLQELIDMTIETLAENDIDEETRRMLNQNLMLYEDYMRNFDRFVNKGIEESIKKQYDAQIQYLQEINQERQEEIDLMQQKLDMNKSMLELDRQIAALEADTSYGAQARLRTLQEQRQTQALEREKFVMDLVTQGMVSQLEKERDEAVLNINRNVQALTEAITGASNTSSSFVGETGQTVSGAGAGKFFSIS